MKSALNILWLLVISVALAAAAWACRTLWCENRRLVAENAQLDVSRIRFATEKECVEERCKALASETVKLTEGAAESAAALAKLASEMSGVKSECAKLQKELDALRAENAQLAEQAKRAKSVARKSDADGELSDPLSGVESLQSLLDLTDKATRKE